MERFIDGVIAVGRKIMGLLLGLILFFIGMWVGMDMFGYDLLVYSQPLIVELYRLPTTLVHMKQYGIPDWDQFNSLSGDCTRGENDYLRRVFIFYGSEMWQELKESDIP